MNTSNRFSSRRCQPLVSCRKVGRKVRLVNRLGAEPASVPAPVSKTEEIERALPTPTDWDDLAQVGRYADALRSFFGDTFSAGAPLHQP